MLRGRDCIAGCTAKWEGPHHLSLSNRNECRSSMNIVYKSIYFRNIVHTCIYYIYIIKHWCVIQTLMRAWHPAIKKTTRSMTTVIGSKGWCRIRYSYTSCLQQVAFGCSRLQWLTGSGFKDTKTLNKGEGSWTSTLLDSFFSSLESWICGLVIAIDCDRLCWTKYSCIQVPTEIDS